MQIKFSLPQKRTAEATAKMGLPKNRKLNSRNLSLRIGLRTAVKEPVLLVRIRAYIEFRKPEKKTSERALKASKGRPFSFADVRVFFGRRRNLEKFSGAQRRRERARILGQNFFSSALIFGPFHFFRRSSCSLFLTLRRDAICVYNLTTSISDFDTYCTTKTCS